MSDAAKKEAPKVDEQGFPLFTIPVLGCVLREKTWIYLSEIILSSFAIYSLICAIVAFLKLKSAATDVSNIATNWQATPYASVSFVQNLPCPAGSTQIPFMNFPGATLGCACDATAKYLTDYKNSQGAFVQIVAASTPGVACLTNQTAAAAVAIYKCMDLPKMDSFPMQAWKGGYFCASTTVSGQSFPSAMNGQQAPDAAGKCAAGFHNCGGTTAADRSTCEPDTAGATSCPINWIGSDKTTFLYNNPSTASLSNSQGQMGINPVTTVSYPGNTGGSTAPPTTFYEQVGKVQVVNVPQNWSPMPLVEVGVAMATPCYGEKNALTGTQAAVGSVVNNGNTVAPAAPDACLSTQGPDTRFAQSDVYSSGTLAFENYLKQPTINVCGSSALTTNYNVFTSTAITQCVSGTGPDSCLTATFPGTSNTGRPASITTCAANDNVCQQYLKQTKCGLWQSMQNTGATASIYQKAQIYWSDTCPYNKTDVINSEASLKSAIKAQTVLVILNSISNVILILMGFYIACVAYGNRNEPKVNIASDMENIWKPRLTNAFSIIKVPTVIATIAATSKIQKFYVRLSAASCAGTSAADALTNQTFIQLGKDLPSVTTSNVMVLVFDIIGWVPAIWAYISHLCCASKESLTNRDDNKSPNNGL